MCNPAFVLQRIDYRKVLEDDKAGKMKVEVQQVLTTVQMYSMIPRRSRIHAACT